MSPLKITALLSLYCMAPPFAGYEPKQAVSQAMQEAYREFARDELLMPGVSLTTVVCGIAPMPRLTRKGIDLVGRLQGVAV